MDCRGVTCKALKGEGQAKQGLSKSHVAVGEDEESANETERRVCKAAQLPC